MGNRKKKRKPTLKPRDWNMVGLITRSGGKGRHQSKKHKPRAASKQAFRKSLMDVRSSHGAFFMSATAWFSACFSANQSLGRRVSLL